MIVEAVTAFPNLKVAAMTLRSVKTANGHDWSVICWAEGKFYSAPLRENRVAGGSARADR